MKRKAYCLSCLIIAILVAVFAVGYAFAWLIDYKDTELKINGSSAGAYFAGGTGKQDDPYIITNSTHMYNLAWLQNTGRLIDFNDVEKKQKKYYFALGSNVEMNGVKLPPIGNDEYPFISEFDGNGYTISNLQITTDKSQLYACPVKNDPDYKFSNAVGMFGMTANVSESDKCSIKNFVLQNPNVHVSAAATAPYNGGENKANNAVGLAIGHVSGKCQSIGVRALSGAQTALDIDRTGYNSFNSILGELADGVQSSVTGGGHIAGSGGSGASFGSSFDIEDMVRRLNLIKENKTSGTPSWRLPNVDTGSNYTIPDKGAKMPFSVDSTTSTYTGADAKEDITNNNVGYFLGNQNKIEQTREISFSEPLIDPGIASVDWYTVAKDGTHESPADSDKVPAWIYKFDGGYSLGSDVYTSQMGFAPLSQEEFDALPQDIRDIFPEDLSTKKKFLKISLSTALWINEGEKASPTISLSDDNNIWSYHGQISWMGKTYGEGFRGPDGDAVDENGEKYSYLDSYNNTKYYKLAEYPNGVLLPNSTIWFKPSQAGKVKIIMFSPGNLRGFALLKIVRKSADKEHPFQTEVKNVNWNYTSDIEISQVMRVRLPKNVLFYYEYEITQETIDAGNVEYMMVGENNGADFIYLDLGANASQDVSTVVPEVDVSAVDFIYDGVEIEQTDETIGIGNFIVGTSGNKALYEASKTSIYFENTQKILDVVYVRLYGRDDSKTVNLANYTTSTIGGSELYATFANYVLPEGIKGGSGISSGGGSGGSETVAVDSVSISGAPSGSINVGDTVTLSASVSPSNATNKTVTWSTSDESVATVENGVVTAVGAGTATITATAGGKSANVEITVGSGEVIGQGDKGVYTFTVGSSTAAEGSLGTAADIISTTFTPSGDYYNLSANSSKITFTFDVVAGQKVGLSIKGYTGSSSYDVGVKVDSYSTDLLTMAGTGVVDFPKTSTASNQASGTIEFTAKASGTVTIVVMRSQAHGTRATEFVLSVGQ